MPQSDGVVTTPLLGRGVDDASDRLAALLGTVSTAHAPPLCVPD
jgi:hypothetical protein